MLLVKIYFEKYVDNYENGQGNYVNEFIIEQQVHFSAIDKFVAIEQVMYNHGLSFDKEGAEIEANGTIRYSNLVDSTNCEVNEDSVLYTKWQAGEIDLYNLDAYIEIFELNKI